ncbi:MAG: hypothetical protein H0U74_18915 [Bradymonadaceae bacterium]|nr:hypothetical protein [Lujinxingiaceae bacterium]
MTQNLKRPSSLLLSMALAASLLVGSSGCGSDAGSDYEPDRNNATNNSSNNTNSNNDNNAGEANNSNNSNNPDPFIPEQEEFLVREVAATDNHVFVPNSDPDSNTVALIDGRDFSVLPLRVGRQPTQVRAAQIEGIGSVAYVLCEGSSVIALVRADMSSGLDRGHVNLLSVPREVNALTMAPDGRHALAYIDPRLPLNSGASVASLQTLALIRLGNQPSEDRVFELSVTRLISSIQFTSDSREAFVVGREGVNRIALSEIMDDAFVAPIGLNLSDSIFPPDDQEVVVSADGSFMVVRTSQFAGIALFRLPGAQTPGSVQVVELSAIPTDVDLIERTDSSGAATRTIMATLRSREQVALIDIDALFGGAEAEDALTLIDVNGAQAGLARLTPDADQVLIYSGLVATPLMGVLDLESGAVRTHMLRNQIRSLAISEDSKSAVIVHHKQAGTIGAGTDPLEVFQRSYGMTIFDIATGYSRPLVLQGEPTDIVMTRTPDGRPIVYSMLVSSDPSSQGIMRVDLTSFRSDFVRLARKPIQLGTVAGKVFVNQDSPTGRITFFDIETQSQRTVSGYELNAGID